MSANDQTDLKRHLAPVDSVPVCRPRLPIASSMLPYLMRIDEARWYSNHGYLVLEFQQRLSELLGGNYVAAASSGTSAIAGAILAVAGRARPEKRFCLIPANTFIGSVAAVLQCGYEPYFVNVDCDTWQLGPEMLANHPKLPETGLVLAVSAYGRSVPQAPWNRFLNQHGIPVVIDGAAMVETAIRNPHDCLGPIPVALSFHATKALATGEGGAVVTSSEELWQKSIQTMNFGYDIDRLSKLPSINAKMSEYNAAVGLAELDTWTDKLAGYARAAEHLRQIDDLADALVTMPEISSCYAIHVAANPEGGRDLRRKLSVGGIGCRQWYAKGAHAHPYTADFLRDDLSATEELMETLTGLPMSPDQNETEASAIAKALAER